MVPYFFYLNAILDDQVYYNTDMFTCDCCNTYNFVMCVVQAILSMLIGGWRAVGEWGIQTG